MATPARRLRTFRPATDALESYSPVSTLVPGLGDGVVPPVAQAQATPLLAPVDPVATVALASAAQDAASAPVGTTTVDPGVTIVQAASDPVVAATPAPTSAGAIPPVSAIAGQSDPAAPSIITVSAAIAPSPSAAGASAQPTGASSAAASPPAQAGVIRPMALSPAAASGATTADDTSGSGSGSGSGSSSIVTGVYYGSGSGLGSGSGSGSASGSGSSGSGVPTYYPILFQGTSGGNNQAGFLKQDPNDANHYTIPNGVPIGAGLSFSVHNIDTSNVQSYTWSGGDYSSLKSYFSTPGDQVASPFMSGSFGLVNDRQTYQFYVRAEKPGPTSFHHYTVTVKVTYKPVPGGQPPDSTLTADFDAVPPITADFSNITKNNPSAILQDGNIHCVANSDSRNQSFRVGDSLRN